MHCQHPYRANNDVHDFLVVHFVRAHVRLTDATVVWCVARFGLFGQAKHLGLEGSEKSKLLQLVLEALVALKGGTSALGLVHADRVRFALQQLVEALSTVSAQRVAKNDSVCVLALAANEAAPDDKFWQLGEAILLDHVGHPTPVIATLSARNVVVLFGEAGPVFRASQRQQGLPPHDVVEEMLALEANGRVAVQRFSFVRANQALFGNVLQQK